MSPPRKQPKPKTAAQLRGERIKAMSCGNEGPEVAEFVQRPKCNRPADHDPPHRKVRASDFHVVAEWADNTYTVRPT